MVTGKESVKQWERIEVERSASEAQRTGEDDLRDSESNIARYLSPPAETCFPLEYSYYLLGDVRGKAVLDFGCGTGENSHLLARRGARVYGMDISEPLLQIAKKRLAVNGITGGVEFFVGSAHDVPLADESVDVVFGMAILHHLDLDLVAREVKRVLRPGGQAIFQEPTRNSKFIRRLRGLIPYQAPDISPFERPLTDHELRNFAAGFTRYRSKAFMLPSTNLVQILPFADSLVNSFYRFDAVVLKKFPALDYYATVRVIELIK